MKKNLKPVQAKAFSKTICQCKHPFTRDQIICLECEGSLTADQVKQLKEF